MFHLILSVSQEEEKDNDSFLQSQRILILLQREKCMKGCGGTSTEMPAYRMCIFLSRASCLPGLHDGGDSVSALQRLCCYSAEEFDLMSTTKLSTEDGSQETSMSVCCNSVMCDDLRVVKTKKVFMVPLFSLSTWAPGFILCRAQLNGEL